MKKKIGSYHKYATVLTAVLVTTTFGGFGVIMYMGLALLLMLWVIRIQTLIIQMLLVKEIR